MALIVAIMTLTRGDDKLASAKTFGGDARFLATF